ncbi:MAG TPA: chorismate mutase [Bryobacteraceae bacterium]|nr:chorismate mutase [Bryobacteraceae bacterium]
MIRPHLFLLAAALCAGTALAAPQSVEAKLAECRKQIDQTDRQIVNLLNQRAKIVARVGSIKKEANLPVTVPARERQVLDHIIQVGREGPLPPETLRRIYATVLQEMRNWEANLSSGKEAPGSTAQTRNNGK